MFDLPVAFFANGCKYIGPVGRHEDKGGEGGDGDEMRRVALETETRVERSWQRVPLLLLCEPRL